MVDRLTERYKFFQTVIDDVNKRSSGDYDKMSLVDKIAILLIAREIKAELDKQLEEYYPLLNAWCNLDIEEEIEKMGETEFSKLKKLFDESIN